MTKKIYKSSSIVSVRIGSKRYRFSECGCGSMYATSKKEEQEALESYSGFGKLYVLEGAEEFNVEKVETPAVEEENLKTVKVSSVAEARDYLVDNYEMSRTSLRNKEAVLTAAKSVGVTFEGLK